MSESQGSLESTFGENTYRFVFSSGGPGAYGEDEAMSFNLDIGHPFEVYGNWNIDFRVYTELQPGDVDTISNLKNQAEELKEFFNKITNECEYLLDHYTPEEA